MNESLALIRTEAKLLFREPVAWLAAVALPSAILLIFGTMFASGPADPGLGGLRFIDVFVPSLVVITVGTLGIQTLPIRLATYREKGVLRRLSTTPAHPLPAPDRAAHHLPRDRRGRPRAAHRRRPRRVRRPASRATSSATSRRSSSARRRCSSIGLLLAAVAPSARVATAVAIPLFFAVMFLGGVYVPRAALPDVLIRIGEFTPPGVQGLQDAWMGDGPQLVPLVVMAILTVVGGALAARAFRWE